VTDSNICGNPGTRPVPEPYAAVLGTAQDAGYPAAGCTGDCCAQARGNQALRRFAACLAIVDPASGDRWLIDCTPDFREQLALLDRLAPVSADAANAGLAGILLSHAHIGHYTGLIHLGREAMNSSALPVYAMPQMASFLRDNEPWAQLAGLEQIGLRQLTGGRAVVLNQRIAITPIVVPHRGELSETVGFLVSGPRRSVFYLPDIDSWEQWQDGIMELVVQADILYLDGTFYSGNELQGRDLAEIPHPTIAASLEFLADLSVEHRSRIRFIHFNHSNPLLIPNSEQANAVVQAGFGIARQGEILKI
jgi:pyrroloquinoline quinone biosynthesis protein B